MNHPDDPDEGIQPGRNPSGRRFDEEEHLEDDGVPDIELKKDQASADLTPLDWCICIFCSGIGCIVGIVRLVQGKPSAYKMIGVSLVAGVIWNVIQMAVREALRR